MSAFDAFAQYHYELHLRLKFHEETGDAFQVLFSRLMSKTYPGDFQATRPWGNVGDRKCDGYRVSTRTLYQCYAPFELRLGEAKAKILDDFNGALPHHGTFWVAWVFVHNAIDGRLATDVVQLLETLRQNNPDITIGSLSYEEIRQMVFALPVEQVVSLLGPPPSMQALANLGLRDINALLLRWGEAPLPPPSEVRPTPAQKIEFNKLPDWVARFLILGMSRAGLVEKALTTHPDPEFCDRVAEIFRQKYLSLRAQGDSPEKIYEQLLVFTVGPLATDLRLTLGAYAVLAYFFEQCEIFERPIPRPIAP